MDCHCYLCRKRSCILFIDFNLVRLIKSLFKTNAFVLASFMNKAFLVERIICLYFAFSGKLSEFVFSFQFQVFFLSTRPQK